jgi:uncharacterized protein YqjF (DUF2071 family)
MTACREGAECRYESARLRGSGECKTSVSIGDQLPQPEVGSLDFFLIERYVFYTLRDDELYTGHVHHSPYPLYSATADSCEECLVEAEHIEPRPWEHAVYSPGVDVSVFPLSLANRAPNHP